MPDSSIHLEQVGADLCVCPTLPGVCRTRNKWPQTFVFAPGSLVSDPVTRHDRKSEQGKDVRFFISFGMTRMGWGCFLAVFPVALIFSSSVQACVGLTVRDAAFVEARARHRLCVMATSDDPRGEEIESELADWFIGSGSGLNLELLRVAVDDPSVKWEEYGIPSAPPSAPVVVLSGRDDIQQRSFYIHHWEPKPTTQELALLESSPVRDFLRKEVMKRLAVLLYVPGTDPATGRFSEAVHTTAEKWSKKEKLGVSVAQLDRRDPNERILVSFLGVPESGPDWLALVFGKGKIGPPIEGQAISEAALDGELGKLTAECTCLETAAGFGVDLPMKWSRADDRAVLPLHEGDALSEIPPVASVVDIRTMRSTLYALASLVGLILFTGGLMLWRRNESVF